MLCIYGVSCTVILGHVLTLLKTLRTSTVSQTGVNKILSPPSTTGVQILTSDMEGKWWAV